MWYIRISTLSGNSAAREASNEAHEASGDSRVPRSPSVRIETLRFGVLDKESRIVEMSSFSVFPMYSVDRNILRFALQIMPLKAE